MREFFFKGYANVNGSHSHHGVEIVCLGVQRSQGIHDLLKRTCQRKVVGSQGSQAILRLHKNWCIGLSCECGLPTPATP